MDNDGRADGHGIHPAIRIDLRGHSIRNICALTPNSDRADSDIDAASAIAVLAIVGQPLSLSRRAYAADL